MEEIEVGEYVRTEGGLIAKYLGFEKDDSDMEYNRHLFDNKIYWCYEYYIECVYEEDWKQFKEDIVKHSKNLIDLIENKDVLKVRIDKTIMFFGMDEDTLDIKYKELIENIENGEYELLEILTHEQFEANCYKVGGEEC